MMLVWSRIKTPLFGALVFASAVAVGACGEALRLEPPTGSTGAVNPTGSGGGGGAGPVACVSNSDCPTPTSVCDVAKALCVECLVFGDCGLMPGTVCSQGACVCPDAAATWCGDDDCVDLQSSSQHCGSCGHQCFGACVDGACADAWEPVPGLDAPSPRSRHVALWTGSQMIIWGGTTNGSQTLSDGAMYDPASFTWTAMSAVDAPSPRQGASAVWSGERMIVWGGIGPAGHLGNGALFDPVTNKWEPMIENNAPSPRQHHTAVWATNVSRMVVWGGFDGNELNTGGVYDLATGWTPTAALPTPAATRRNHSAVFIGDEMLVYGGIGDAASLMLNNSYWPSGGVPGGRSYKPLENSWDILPSDPPARAEHTAVAAGAVMLLFGGTNGPGNLDSGFKFENDLWSGFSGIAPEARSLHTSVWLEDANRMIVWGGQSTTGYLNSGAAYDLPNNNWDEMPLPTALEPRIHHSAISTGSTMIVWGGSTLAGGRLNSGAIYTP